MRKTIRTLQTWLLVLLAGLLWTGCTPLKISRTVALPGLTPVADAKQITVVEKLEEVTRPYQIVGKVTIWREGTKITQSASLRRIRNLAAQMGADGVIGLHFNVGGALYTGLAVKWLSPGEKRQPTAFPFVVAALPIVTDPTAPGKQEKVAKFVVSRLDYLLESKGYYLIPGVVSNFSGGIEGAKNLDAAALLALGGNDAQLLLEINLHGRREVSAVVYAEATSYVQATLLDKQTRKIVYEERGSGSFASGSLFVNAFANAKRQEAAVQGTLDALRNLKPVHQPTSR